ncbi:MAG: terpene cyclase/mutase family protein [Lentisphaerae bacterium]|nr:terpene cyclase/mutase family protein [Lentisphaerota bacterium]
MIPNEYEALRALMARHGLMSLFRRASPRQRIARVVAGLRAERGSGENKHARLQVVRLSAPLGAVMVPILGVLLLSLLAKARPDPVHVGIIEMVEEEVPLPLDPTIVLTLDPIRPPEPLPLDAMLDADVVTEPPEPVKTKVLESPVELVDLFSAAPARSPMAFSGVLENRDAGKRAAAMLKFKAPGITEGAVLRALRWLKEEQLPDGSWAKTKPAMTGLALLTFLAHGETPASEEFGETVMRAIQWLVENQEANGMFKGRDGHNYSHPIATYALCEAFALTRVPMVQEAAERALAIVIEGQHASGGWDYNCKQSMRDDTSYMGWCVQALKAAKEGGLHHPDLRRAMSQAVEGFRKNAHPQGGFGYTSPGQGGLTGVGVACMQLLGAAKEPEARRGLAYLAQEATFSWREPWGGSPMYYWYYATQAHFFAGGSAWSQWNARFPQELVRAQTILRGASPNEPDMGYWDSPGTHEHSDGRVQDTCLSTLQLEVYYRYLRTLRPPDESDEVERLATGPDVIRVEVVI